MKKIPLWKAKILLALFIAIPVKGKLLRGIFERLWQKIWLDEGYATEENIAEIAHHYELYQPYSKDFVLTFLFVFPIGTFRLILKNPNILLPVEKDFEITKLWQEEDLIVEATLLTILPRFRKKFGGISFLAATRFIYRKACNLGAKAIVIAADRRLYYLLTKFLKLPFQQIGEPKFYEGSITIPGVLFIKKAEEIVPPKNPYLARLFK